MDELDQEQEYYLDLLSKYSGREKVLKVVSSQDIPSKKIAFIKDNFHILNIDEQVLFNQYMREIRKQISYSFLFGGMGGIGLFFYYVINKPLTKNLYMEGCKSLVLGTLVGIGYNRVQQYYFNNNIHQIYLIGLQRTRGARHL